MGLCTDASLFSPIQLTQISLAHQSGLVQPQYEPTYGRNSSDIWQQVREKEVDRKRGASCGQGLPAYIRTDYRMWLRGGVLSTRSLGRSNASLARKIGEIDWRPNDSNIRAVQEALAIVTLEDFETKWDKRRFSVQYGSWFRNLRALQGNLWVLDAYQLLVAREKGIIKTLPRITTDEIDDRNKGDALVKILAVVQVTWFFTQAMTRFYYHLSISQMEVMVLSFSLCAVLTYCLLIDKPKDVGTSITINATRYPTAEELIQITTAGPTVWPMIRRSIWMPNNSVHYDSKKMALGTQKMANGCVFALLIFGVVHCVAWDFVFSSPLGKLLWRVSSIITLAAVPLSIVWSSFASMIRKLLIRRQVDKVWPIDGFGNWIIFSAFCLSRLFILVEVFRSLSTLPSGVFETTWSDHVPHFG